MLMRDACPHATKGCVVRFRHSQGVDVQTYGKAILKSRHGLLGYTSDGQQASSDEIDHG